MKAILIDVAGFTKQCDVPWGAQEWHLPSLPRKILSLSETAPLDKPLPVSRRTFRRVAQTANLAIYEEDPYMNPCRELEDENRRLRIENTRLAQEVLNLEGALQRADEDLSTVTNPREE